MNQEQTENRHNMVSIYNYNTDSTPTDISRATPTTSSYDTLYYSNDGYSVHGDYTFRRKHETNKECLIRQRAAFKLFYHKVTYTVRKTKKDFLAENTETIKRESKFKSINLNLII